MNTTAKAKEEGLTEEERQRIGWLAAILWLLPPKLRYRFFSAFHPDLRRFFEGQGDGEGETGEVVAKVAVSGEAWVRWEGKRGKEGRRARGKGQVVTWKFLMPMEFGGQVLSVAIEVRQGKARRCRVRVEGGEGLVEALIAAVKGMREAERDFLWGLMDEALADYEDHLLATDPELIREHEEALAEIERGEYVIYGGEGSG
ncbi:MAG: hypothetical protein RRB24_03525 [Armatimonadota bacterium]|jgi:hypothetical protein|nr:hypothetical protein [Armatimonadota bacterium]MDT7971877.1 hypothetical protein [Armatimonadota bacterium]